jgi:hypothetical protein
MAGLGVPFHGSIAFSRMAPPASEAGCRPNLPSSGKFSLALPRLPRGRAFNSTDSQSGASRAPSVPSRELLLAPPLEQPFAVDARSASLLRDRGAAVSSSGSTRCFCAHAMLQRILRRAPCPRADFAPFFRLASARALLTGTAARSAAVALDMTRFLGLETVAGWCGPEAPCGLAPVAGLTHHRNIGPNAPRLCHAFGLAAGLANRTAPCREPDMLRKQAS